MIMLKTCSLKNSFSAEKPGRVEFREVTEKLRLRGDDYLSGVPEGCREWEGRDWGMWIASRF